MVETAPANGETNGSFCVVSRPQCCSIMWDLIFPNKQVFKLQLDSCSYVRFVAFLRVGQGVVDCWRGGCFVCLQRGIVGSWQAGEHWILVNTNGPWDPLHCFSQFVRKWKRGKDVEIVLGKWRRDRIKRCVTRWLPGDFQGRCDSLILRLESRWRSFGCWVSTGSFTIVNNGQVKVWEVILLSTMDKSSRSDPGPSPSPSLHPLGLASQVEFFPFGYRWRILYQ